MSDASSGERAAPGAPAAVRQRVRHAARRRPSTAAWQPGERLRDAELCEWLGLQPHARARRARAPGGGRARREARRSATRGSRPSTAAPPRDAAQIVAAVHALAAELAVPDLDERRPRTLSADANDSLRRRAGPRRRRRGRSRPTTPSTASSSRPSGNGEIERTIARLIPRLRRVERPALRHALRPPLGRPARPHRRPRPPPATRPAPPRRPARTG